MSLENDETFLRRVHRYRKIEGEKPTVKKLTVDPVMHSKPDPMITVSDLCKATAEASRSSKTSCI